MLLRLIDDYLFITTDLNKARRFLDAMIKGMELTFLFIVSKNAQDTLNTVVLSRWRRHLPISNAPLTL
jgi:hypothetical protein